MTFKESKRHFVSKWPPGPDLLVITGEEATTRNGSYVIAGLPAGTWIDWRYRAMDDELPGFLDVLHRDGAIAVAAHPFATCLACAWKFGYGGMDAVEVWNGPWTADDEVAVQMWNGMLVESARTGHWLPAMGDSDAHSEPQVIGLPHNVVLADDRGPSPSYQPLRPATRRHGRPHQPHLPRPARSASPRLITRAR